MKTVQVRFNKLLFAKEAKLGRRIKQDEVAEATGLSIATIGSYSRGDVTRFDARVIGKLCGYFDCSVGDLLTLEGESDAETNLLAAV